VVFVVVAFDGGTAVRFNVVTDKLWAGGDDGFDVLAIDNNSSLLIGVDYLAGSCAVAMAAMLPNRAPRRGIGEVRHR